MSGEKFTVRTGYIEPRTFHKFEHGQMVGYCYSVEYDSNGKEISRTEPTRLGSIGFFDGSDFTEEDYKNIKYGYPAPKKGFFARLFNI